MHLRENFRGKLALAVAFAALALAFAAAPAAARSLEIIHFGAEIQVNADGTLDVTETIEAHFTGSWNGLIRTIPVEYQNKQGFNYSLLLDVTSVTDDNFAPLRYESSRAGQNLKLKIYNATERDSTHIIHIGYKVHDGLRFFDEHDELYWNITGDEWTVPIGLADAHITLPAGATGVRATAFTGAYASHQKEAEVEVSGNTVQFRTQRPLSFREGLTVVVGWDKGSVTEPGSLTRAGYFLRSNWPFSIPGAVLLVLLLYWYFFGRDPRQLPFAVQYTPPPDLSPGEAGTLLDNSADMRDITATLVDLAIRGYLRIEETEKEQMLGLMHSKDYIFRLLKTREEWKDLKGHERELLYGLFSGDAFVKGSMPSVTLSDLQNKFFKRVPVICDSIFNELMAGGFYKSRPDAVKKAFVGAGALVGYVLFKFGGGLSRSTGVAFATWAVTGILTGVVIAVFGFLIHERTVEGTRALEGVLGFEEFLKRVETDHFERVVKTPEMFEKFLPYAMAFGVEMHWSNAFKGIYSNPPQWYQGSSYGSQFAPAMFVSSLSQMNTRAAAVMTSAPRSAGTSGFSSGGGFSGGGFGGGGGSGF